MGFELVTTFCYFILTGLKDNAQLSPINNSDFYTISSGKLRCIIETIGYQQQGHQYQQTNHFERI
jgi:hypothetical protein